MTLEEKPSLDTSATKGCMALGPRAINTASKSGLKPPGVLMSDFVQSLLNRRMRVATYHTKRIWYDIGIIASYEKVNRELKDEIFPFLGRQPERRHS